MPKPNFQADIEIEQHIKDMPDRELMEFTARQVYSVCATTRVHDQRISNLESTGRKLTGLAGGIGTGVGAAIVGVIDYLIHR